MLLLTSETALEAEVREALRIRQQEREPGLFFELTYVDPALFSDFLGVLDLLDHVRSGFFDMVHIVPSAATWSRSRHSEHSGQFPLRSRSSPLGLSSLSPDKTQNINKANRALEVAAWVAEQSLQCPSKFNGLNIIFPEDLGGHCEHGPSSMWVLREFRFLEGVRDARRAAAYMCQFTRSEYKRPIGIFSNCTSLRPLLFSGWPNLIQAQNSLTYRGPLPLSCSCGREHIPFIGLSCDSTFRTSSSVGFGAGFWISCVFTMIHWKGVSFPLGMAIDLISLLWAILRSSHRRWPPLRIRYGPRTRRGKLVRLRRHLWWTSLLQIPLRPISLLRLVLLWARLLALVCARSGRCLGFRFLVCFRPVLLLALLPRLQRSVRCARDHAHPVV